MDDEYARSLALRVLLRFVQAIPYCADRGGEYPRYPSEMVMDGCGDCEDSAILFAAIASALGYECALLRFSSDGFLGLGRWGHIGLGIAEETSGELSGTYWTYDGRRYYYCSCNGYGRGIGDSPGDKYSRAQIYPIG